MTWEGAWLASGDDGAAGEGMTAQWKPDEGQEDHSFTSRFFFSFLPQQNQRGLAAPIRRRPAKRPVSEWVSGRSPAERGRDLPTGRAFPNCPGNTWPTPPETKTEGKERRSWVLIKVAQQVTQAGAVQYQKGCDASVWVAVKYSPLFT